MAGARPPRRRAAAHDATDDATHDATHDDPGPPCRISVVVLTHNRCDALRHTLRQLTELPERPPIVVVDNASSDATVAMLAADFPQVSLLRAPANLGAAGRNLGAAAACTPYVAFCDDDTWWHPGSLALSVALLERHPTIGALSARVLVGPECRDDPTCVRMGCSPLSSVGLPGRAILGLMAGATVFRREAFQQAHGYHPRFFIGSEESLLSLDLAVLGWTMVYVPELVVHHHPSPLRESERRHQLTLRNAIWCAWLRLPAFQAASASLHGLPELWRQGGWAACRDLLRGVPWVLRERRVVPPRVLAMQQLVAR